MQTVSQIDLGGGSRALFGEIRRVASRAATRLSAWRTEYVFLIRIDRVGAIHVDRGSMRPQLLADLCTLFAQLDVRTGWVAGVREGMRVRLLLCDHWPVDVRQRVRDAWAKNG